MNCLLCNNTIDFKLNIKWILSLEKYKQDNVYKRCREELGKCKIDNACEGCGREQKKLLLCNDCIKWKNNNKILLNNKSIYTYNNLIIKKYFERYKFMGDYYWRKIFNIEFKNFITNNYPSKDWIYIPIPVDEYTMQHRGFNQVEGLIGDLPYSRVLKMKKLKRDKKQSEKSRSERLKTQQPFEYIGDKLQGNYVIIDDVYTTGRTLYYAQELLLKNGASRVCSVTLAR